MSQSHQSHPHRLERLWIYENSHRTLSPESGCAYVAPGPNYPMGRLNEIEKAVTVLLHHFVQLV
jgi:hypothetical protein